jgi:CheY-like chemotaxis protein
MTAHALKGDREECLAAGMDEYIAKPIHVKQLLETMVAVLRPAGSGDHNAALPDVMTREPPVRDTGGLDWVQIEQDLHGDRQLVDIAVTSALEEIPRLLAAIVEAITRGDADALRLAAHTLKGSVRYFGATPAFDLAVQLEQIGKDGDLSQSLEKLAVLKAHTSHLVAALEEYQARHASQG